MIHLNLLATAKQYSLNKLRISKNQVAIGAFFISSICIWFFAPLVHWNHHYFFITIEKKIYCIIALWLIGFLILLFKPQPQTISLNKDQQKKIIELRQRIDGIMQFLTKTEIMQQGEATCLANLPWYVLIGPEQSGKTSLLAHAPLQFLLQKTFSHENKHKLSPSNHIDFWATREAVFIDIPSYYLLPNQRYLWKESLALIHQIRKKNGIQGLLINLALPSGAKEYKLALHSLLQRLFNSLKLLSALFNTPIPCQLIFTQCDKMPGFVPFFSESTQEDLAQGLGISLGQVQAPHFVKSFSQQFNGLIKRINQQLINRLHTERNPFLRPAIKDFPLRFESLKLTLLKILKKWETVQYYLPLQGIYFTSAFQPEPPLATSTPHDERQVQVYQASLFSRSYFTKDILLYGFQQPHTPLTPAYQERLKRKMIYGGAAFIVTASALLLAADFKESLDAQYAIRNLLNHYQQQHAQITNERDKLKDVLLFLEKLENHHQIYASTALWHHLPSFYSLQLRSKTKALFQHVLLTDLLPLIPINLEEFLSLPVNKDAASVYAALKSYLMLNQLSHLNSNFIATTFAEILPSSEAPNLRQLLIKYTTQVLHLPFKPINIQENLVDQTRSYLIGLPHTQLSYILLKNINNNFTLTNLPLGDTTLFTHSRQNNQIPAMFMGNVFSKVFQEDIPMAAEETIMGNWVLGTKHQGNAELIAGLTEQLRLMYVNNYIDIWESFLANIRLKPTTNLSEATEILKELSGINSPLVEFLNTVYLNTYFEPIANISPKLQALDQLLTTQRTQTTSLSELLTALKMLHTSLQNILQTANIPYAAFKVTSERIQQRNAQDALNKLHQVAAQSPEPVKFWLEQIANETWHYLLTQASLYIDLSWQEKVSKSFAMLHATKNADQWSYVFGQAGIIPQFFSSYLQPFIDFSYPTWHWRQIDNASLTFSKETLQSIQQAMLIHQLYFGANKTFSSPKQYALAQAAITALHLPEKLIRENKDKA